MFDESSQDAAFAEGLDEGYAWIYRQHPSELNQLRWLYDRTSQQYIVAMITGSISTESVFYGAVPAVSTGDVFVLPLVSSPGGYPITPNADGTVSIAAAGDTSRQSMSVNVYDLSTSAFMGAITDYINNIAPTYIGNKVVIAVERGQTITPVDISGYWVDHEGDSLSFTFISAPPGGLDVNTFGVIAGTTPNANSITTETIRGTDVAGDSADGAFTLIVGNVVTPDTQTTHMASALAQGAITAAFLTPAIGASVFSASVPVGSVVSQSPAPGNEVAPFSTVTLMISAGPTGPVAILSQVSIGPYTQGSGYQSVDLSAYFSGVSAFSIAESAYLASISGSLAGSILSLPTDAAGTFGPFTVTGSNNTNTATLNPFSYFVSPTPAPPTNLGLSDRPATTLRKFLL